MSNANRDYLVICDVKNSKITIARPMNFYVTDRNTSNIFVKLVTQITTDDGIKQYVDIENATDYTLTLRVVKPNNETKSVVASELIDGSIYQIDLAEDYKDMAGTYKCELLVSTTVNGRQELNTSDPFMYNVKRSIYANIGNVIPPEDTTTETMLNRLDALEAGGSIDLSGYAKTTDIPTNVSQLTNDSNYTTQTYVTNAIAQAQLGGGSGDVDLSGFVTTDLGNASQITFGDGETLQSKLDTGSLGGSGGGLDDNTASLLISILRAAAFTSDQSANITALKEALGATGGGSTGGGSTGSGGNTGGGGSTGGIVTDGLVNLFDFRTATYNNNWGSGLTVIEATQGNGSLYCWAANQVTTQDDYGMSISRNMIYNADSVGTTTTNCGTTFTWIFKCYMNNLASPLMSIDYGILSNMNAFSYQPKYNTSSSTSQVTAEGISTRDTGYNTYIISVDGSVCRLYKDATLLKTVDGSTISDFTSWYDMLTFGILGSNTAGYFTQLAVYNKALSEVEIVDMVDYLTTLEVK